MSFVSFVDTPNPMSTYSHLRQELAAEPRTWLVTGVAGFIGSHLLEALLQLGQRVIGLDNISTGSPRNLADVQARVSPEQWARFTYHEGSVADMGACREATNHVDYVLHHAGFVSVPLSIEDPIGCHDTNVTGTLNLLAAARDNRVRRVVYASSSAVYGDDPRAAKIEAQIGRPLSPYGASKLMGEIYARQFFDHYGLESIGPALLQRLRPAAESRGRLRRRHSAVDHRAGPRRRVRDSRRRRDHARLLPRRRMSCRPICSPRPRAIAPRSVRFSTWRSAVQAPRLMQLYGSISARVAAVTGTPAKR